MYQRKDNQDNEAENQDYESIGCELCLDMFARIELNHCGSYGGRQSSFE